MPINGMIPTLERTRERSITATKPSVLLSIKHWMFVRSFVRSQMAETGKVSFQDGIDLINARYYSTVTREEFEQIFNSSEGSSPLPMITERLNVLHETGAILVQVSFID